MPRLPRRPLAGMFAALLCASIVGCGASESVEPVETTVDETVEIMPIGDSITAGPYYRIPLVRAATEAGCPVDFVGTFNGTGVAVPDADAALDLDHQAIGGATSERILGEVRGWMQENQPDVVLLYLGVNDFYNGIDRDTTIQNLESIVEELRSGNRDVTILLAQIMPAVAVEDGVAALDAEIVLLAQRLGTSASSIKVVDLASGVDIDADLVDGVHPNDQQSEEMAKRWADALQEVLGDRCQL